MTWNESCGSLAPGNISSTSGGSAVVADYTCTTNSAGTMTAGVAVLGVTQTITANVTTAGTYNITTTANGVTFTGSGTVAAGTQDILLTATGTPATTGTFSYLLSTTPNCSFSRTVGNNPSSGGSAVVADYTCTTNSAGTMTAGVAVLGVTQTITANVTTAGTYNISTTTVNGVTFSGSGTVAAGTQDILLTATGTPTASGSSTYLLNTTPNCDFNRTVNAAVVTNDPSSNGTAVVSLYLCNTAYTGTLIVGTPISGGVTQTITAIVTTPGTYNILATINGVAFAANGTFTTTGGQNIVLNAIGTPFAAGDFSYVLNTNPSCDFTRSAVAGFTFGTITTASGKVWMDRNLGATREAQSSTDFLAYGDLYQWGRNADGHQLINWTGVSTGAPVNDATTTSLATADQANNSLFIVSSTAPQDWRQGQNNNLWQKATGINNPCPAGFHVPTSTEFANEFTALGITNSNTAFTRLKLSVSGNRNYSDGALSNVGSNGSYWSSTVSGASATSRNFNATGTNASNGNRANGLTVRCLKD